MAKQVNTATMANEQTAPSGMRVSREEEIASVIKAKYSIDDQIAILRQKDTKPEEYQAFFSFAEEVKAAVTAARAAEAAAQDTGEEEADGE